ncbi:MAG: hypothetical protein H7Z73_07465 [Candidatus Saccharibacteria bacterium]|nr:hypothetical protein [Moraxellaceae bacterium]
MQNSELKSRALYAAKVFRSLELNQDDIALSIGASQSQVSRILSGNAIRSSRLFEEICIYAENLNKKTSSEAIRSNKELVDALADTWDGTPAHSKALASVIRSLAVLSSPEVKVLSLKSKVSK